jgi:hypothetical protein
MPDLVSDIDRLEEIYLQNMLGSLAVPSDTQQDLRRKFYGGIADGSASPLGPAFGSGYLTGRYYGPFLGPGSAGTLVAVLNTLYFIPIQVFRQYTFAGLMTSINAGIATAVCRLGIYNDAGGIPGTRVKEFPGTIDASTAGQKELLEATLLAPGLYYLAVVAQTAAPTFDGRSCNNPPSFMTFINQAQVPLNSGVWRQSGVTGALPTPAVPDSMGSTTPVLALKG